MSEHEEQAERLERELDDMQEQSEHLGEQVDEARKDWERKQRDPSVPGASGDPERAEGDPPPEQQYTSKGD
jgi:predicted  nucleic acid-binding Zn-ribbon protein